MNKPILLSAVTSALFVFSVAATADPAPIGINAPAVLASALEAGLSNGTAPNGNNGYAATPAQPNGMGVPATPAMPGNPRAAQEVRRHRREMRGFYDNRRDIRAPDVERPAIERPTVERPTIERPTFERPNVHVPLFHR